MSGWGDALACPGQALVEGEFVSRSNHASRRWLALVGTGVVAASMFVAVGTASAATPTNTRLSTSTPSIGVGGIAKLKAVVKPATGTVQPTGTVTFKENGVTAPASNTVATCHSARTR